MFSANCLDSGDGLPLFTWHTLQRVVRSAQLLICPSVHCTRYCVDKRLFCVAAGIFQTLSKNDHLADLLQEVHLYNIYFYDPAACVGAKSEEPAVEYYEVCYGPSRIQYQES